jgi:4-hydroxybenzoate polyprenyltransferase
MILGENASMPLQLLWRAFRESVRTSRPIGWIVSVGLFRAGIAYGKGPETWATVAMSLMLSLPFCFFLFGLNDAYDEESDRINPRKGTWIHGVGSSIWESRNLLRSSLAAGAVVLAITPFLRPLGGALIASVVFIGWAYSARPLRLKEWPVIDGLCTALIMLGLMGGGYACVAEVTHVPAEFYMVVPSLAGLHIFGSAVDESADKVAGHKTLAVRAGPRVATAFSLAISLVSAASVAFLSYAPPIPFYLILQPIVLFLNLLAPKWASPRRSLATLGLSGAATVLGLIAYYCGYFP